MKVLKVLAWVGVGFMILGLLVMFGSSMFLVSLIPLYRADPLAVTSKMGAFLGQALGFVLGVLGTLLALVPGFIARPRHLWMGAVIVGIAYILSLYGIILWGMEIDSWAAREVIAVVVLSLPGLACIIGGIVIKRVRNKRIGGEGK